ncbi:hypothetical protein ACIOD2_25660, partial [Amycolatopsis sp. NPDC088138]|uniref:hypothetical protein n=1 Tax=Amycolatopsis sp. NPDC088138 TaxID=3363938 RepID=UPI0037F3E281
RARPGGFGDGSMIAAKVRLTAVDATRGIALLGVVGQHPEATRGWYADRGFRPLRYGHDLVGPMIAAKVRLAAVDATCGIALLGVGPHPEATRDGYADGGLLRYGRDSVDSVMAR